MSTELAHPKMSLDAVVEWIDGLFELRELAVEEGELPDQLAVIDQQIDEAFAKQVQKCDDIAYARKVWNLAVEDVDSEIERLTDRKKMFKGRIDRLDAATIYALKRHEERTGHKKIETPLNTIRYQANGGLQPLDTSGMVLTGPNAQIDYLKATVTLTLAEWQSVAYALTVCDTPKTTAIMSKMRPQINPNLNYPQPDNAAIREALERGVEIPGARLKPRGEQLRCR